MNEPSYLLCLKKGFEFSSGCDGCCYDLANLIRLATEAGHLHSTETIGFLNMLSILFEQCVKEKIPYVHEDRKD